MKFNKQFSNSFDIVREFVFVLSNMNNTIVDIVNLIIKDIRSALYMLVRWREEECDKFERFSKAKPKYTN